MGLWALWKDVSKGGKPRKATDIWGGVPTNEPGRGRRNWGGRKKTEKDRESHLSKNPGDGAEIQSGESTGAHSYLRGGAVT